MSFQLAIIGGGSIGEALLEGVIKYKQYPLDKVIISEPLKERRDFLEKKYRVHVTDDNSEAALNTKTIVMAVKPQFFFKALKPISDLISVDQVLVSVAAGISISEIERYLKAKVPVIRVMTNTPLLVGEGATVLARGNYVLDEDMTLAKDLFRNLGLILELSENKLNGVTALSGSGPAYIYLITEALIESGVRIGLPRKLSKELVFQTILGSLQMAKDTDKHLAELKESVTSPGGTTAAALEHLEAEGIRGIIIQAVVKAHERAVELSLLKE